MEPPDLRSARPREVKGLIAPGLRALLTKPYRGGLWFFLKIGASPDHITIASLVAGVAVAVTLARGARAVPAVLLLVSGILDVFDGAVARTRGISSARGAWLDSVVDRLSDGLIFGALFLSLVWQHDRMDAGLALASLVVSLLVSDIRAEAEARGARMGEGAFARAERFIVLVAGLWLPHALRPALALLAGLGAFTLGQRVWIARGILASASRGDGRSRP